MECRQDSLANSTEWCCPICGVGREERPMIRLCENDHSFCMKCIEKWRKRSFQEERDFTCPICRSLQEKFQLLSGKIVTYYTNSTQKSKEANYYSGIRHGKYRKWYPNGQLKEERYFIDGYEDGESYFYDEDGKCEIILYQMGEEIEQTRSWTFSELAKSLFRL